MLTFSAGTSSLLLWTRARSTSLRCRPPPTPFQEGEHSVGVGKRFNIKPTGFSGGRSGPYHPASVARMQHSMIRVSRARGDAAPGFAALHPGYELRAQANAALTY
jgi:hypothetical protein